MKNIPVERVLAVLSEDVPMETGEVARKLGVYGWAARRTLQFAERHGYAERASYGFDNTRPATWIRLKMPEGKI